MAKFNIIGAAIGTVPASKNNAGKKYLRLLLQNAFDVFGHPYQWLCFEEKVAEAFAPYISNKLGGTAGDEDKELPNSYQFVYGAFETKQYSRGFWREYMSDLTDGASHTHKKGEPICDANGNKRVYTSLQVFVRKVWNPDTRSTEEIQGQTVDSLADNIFNASCHHFEVADEEEVEVVEERPEAQQAANNANPFGR